MVSVGKSKDAESQRRAELRLQTRVADTYARSAVGGFLYLAGWIPLVVVADLHLRYPVATVCVTVGFLMAAFMRIMARPPRQSAQAQRRWINRYTAISMLSTVIWAAVQFAIIADDQIGPMIKSASLFGTIAFSTVFAHLYTTLLRISITGIVILIVPASIILWTDPRLHLLAISMALYAIYLIAAVARSHVDYQRRLDLDEALREQSDRYEALSRTDSLTGLCNRRQFTGALHDLIWQALLNTDAKVTLMLFDIDHFKSINDHHGHVVGDEALRHFANRLEANFAEPGMLVARTGGEEFAVIVQQRNEHSAVALAHAFRDVMAGKPIECAGLQLRVTVSIGVGTFSAELHRDDDGLYGAVDIALYAAKQQGRNRVVSISELAGDFFALAPDLAERRQFHRAAGKSLGDA